VRKDAPRRRDGQAADSDEGSAGAAGSTKLTAYTPVSASAASTSSRASRVVSCHGTDSPRNASSTTRCRSPGRYSRSPTISRTSTAPERRKVTAATTGPGLSERRVPRGVHTAARHAPSPSTAPRTDPLAGEALDVAGRTPVRIGRGLN